MVSFVSRPSLAVNNHSSVAFPNSDSIRPLISLMASSTHVEPSLLPGFLIMSGWTCFTLLKMFAPNELVQFGISLSSAPCVGQLNDGRYPHFL